MKMNGNNGNPEDKTRIIIGGLPNIPTPKGNQTGGGGEQPLPEDQTTVKTDAEEPGGETETEEVKEKTDAEEPGGETEDEVENPAKPKLGEETLWNEELEEEYPYPYEIEPVAQWPFKLGAVALTLIALALIALVIGFYTKAKNDSASQQAIEIIMQQQATKLTSQEQEIINLKKQVVLLNQMIADFNEQLNGGDRFDPGLTQRVINLEKNQSKHPTPHGK